MYLFRHITTHVPKKASGSRSEEQVVQRSNDLFSSFATRSIIAHETMHISLKRPRANFGNAVTRSYSSHFASTSLRALSTLYTQNVIIPAQQHVFLRVRKRVDVPASLWHHASPVETTSRHLQSCKVFEEINVVPGLHDDDDTRPERQNSHRNS